MSRPRHSFSALQRRLARFALAFVAIFIAAGYLASIAHMALVAHAACAEHGKLVHVGLGAASDHEHSDADLDDVAPATDARAGRSARHGDAASEGESIAEGEHDHCVVGTARPGESVAARAPISVLLDEAPPAPVTPEAPHPSCDRVEPPPQIALLDLSPKISPPG